ncbi:MAG: cellulase family glycosylhydrolase [Phycisphaeraceae bacterium JB051]
MYRYVHAKLIHLSLIAILLFTTMGCNTLLQAQTQGSESPTVLEPYGVTSHWNEAAYYALAKQAGVQWIRIDISWYHIQPTGPDQWQWDRVDAAIDEAQRVGLKVLAILSYTNKWATSGDPAAANYHRYVPREQYDTAYQAYIAAVVSRYVDKINAWEIMNEPDHHGFFKIGSGTWVQKHHPNESDINQRRLQYQHMIGLADTAIAPYRNQITLTTSGFAIGGNSDLQFVDWLSGQGAFFSQYDVLNFHKYGYPNQTSLISGINKFQTLKDQQGLAASMWVTEHGITQHSPDNPPADAQSFFIKSYATALRMGVTKLFWYRHLKGGGTHVSLLKSGNVPSVIYPVYQLLTQHWQNPVSITALTGMHASLDGAIAQLADNSRVAIVWLDDPNDAPLPLADILVPSAPILGAYNLQGQAIHLQSNQTVTSEPVFVHLQP